MTLKELTPELALKLWEKSLLKDRTSEQQAISHGLFDVYELETEKNKLQWTQNYQGYNVNAELLRAKEKALSLHRDIIDIVTKRLEKVKPVLIKYLANL